MDLSRSKLKPKTPKVGRIEIVETRLSDLNTDLLWER